MTLFETGLENFPWIVQEISVLELLIAVGLVSGKGFMLTF